LLDAILLSLLASGLDAFLALLTLDSGLLGCHVDLSKGFNFESRLCSMENEWLVQLLSLIRI
jgi:hypothetical protein